MEATDRRARYRDALPQLERPLFLTEGGLETTLIFHEGHDLPHFAAYDLLARDGGEDVLRRYFEPYVRLAVERRVGVVLDSPTWRASRDWGERLGHSPDRLADLNRRAVALLVELREEHETETTPIVAAGCIGPRGDGYVVAARMTADEAAAYHATQVETLADTAADFVSAMTMTYADEAVGIVQAAREAGVPVVISFTVETDGCLPSGQSLRDAIEEVDARTDAYAAYFMVNCAHPSHFDAVLEPGAAWSDRILGLRANASRLSHAELDEAEELDIGNPEELALEYVALRERLPRLTVLGGCCGTDHRHVEAICLAWTGA
ncbi:MAG TPA: homocysteine S-methyltransferase family protein [Gaiella sp.]|jgi:S-methylmethionine-dependent homocysteine/selenocysteine methylase|nr:homocysteine S-methyltransferase family protein [Gaiella sp.]